MGGAQRGLSHGIHYDIKDAYNRAKRWGLALAFMTLRTQYVAPSPGEDGQDREYILLKYDEMARAEQRMCEAWRAARVAG